MRQRQVREQPGPLTAHEAWAIVQPIVARLDLQARLAFITSGLDISHAGRSFTWEFMFYLPAQRMQALLSLAPAADADEIDSTPLVLTQRIGPTGAGAEHAPALPLPFRDSPEVVAEFAVGGVDFIGACLQARKPAPFTGGRKRHASARLSEYLNIHSTCAKLRPDVLRHSCSAPQATVCTWTTEPLEGSGRQSAAG